MESNRHEHWMQRCLDLASRGSASVSPNPKVGCVIVRNDVLVSEGYHKAYGQAHAELDAINKLPSDFDFSNCTLYVNLEPCNHHGKTPPCADLIVKKGIATVVCAMHDPNPLVAGTGLRKMKDAGCDVIVGVLEKQAKFLNRQFLVNILESRPYYTAKWAQTANGFMGRKDPDTNRKITGDTSDTIVHRMRAENDAILIGRKTAEFDNPKLNVRNWHGENPLRVVIDPKGALPKRLQIFNDGAKTLVFSNVTKSQGAVEFIEVRNEENIWSQIDLALLDRNIGTVLVEGGRFTLEHLLSINHLDEIHRFSNQELIWESGIPAPEFTWPIYSKIQLGSDLLELSLNPKRSWSI